MDDSKPKPPRTLQEVLEQNRALVAAAPAGVRAVYKMNREFEKRKRVVRVRIENRRAKERDDG